MEAANGTHFAHETLPSTVNQIEACSALPLLDESEPMRLGTQRTQTLSG